MPLYAYYAKDPAGNPVRGELEAIDEKHLMQQLASKNLYLIEAKPAKTRKARRSFAGIKRRDLILFTTHMATSLEAGIPLTTAIKDFADDTSNPRFRKILEDILAQLNAGATFSSALEKYPRAFPEIYVSIVRAGEATGNLDKSLRDLLAFLEWQEDLRRQIIQSSIYPAIIITLVIGVVTLLMTVTLPKISKILLSFNVELPAITRMLIAVSNWFAHYWFLIPLSFAGFYALYFVTYNFTKEGRYIWDMIKLKIPVFGNVQKKLALSRFAHYFTALYRAGIGIIQILSVLERVVGNEVIARAIVRIRNRIIAGESISDAMRKEGIFPQLVIRMMAVGEQTGNMEDTLQKVSDYYDREVPAAIRRFFSFLEPAIIVMLGGLVLVIALSIFLPIYKLTSTITGQVVR